MPAATLNKRQIIAMTLATAVLSTSSQAVVMTSNTVTSKDGTRIAFDRAGEGPALILVGGALSDRSGSAPLAKLLSPHFTVLSYDRRGRGGSGDRAPYAVEREIEDIEALIDAAGGTAFVHGHSSGAVLALEATAKRPDKVQKLSVYEPPFIVDASRPLPPKNYVTRMNDLIAAGRRDDAVAFFLTDVVGTPAEAVTKMRGTPAWPALVGLAHTLPYDIAVLGDGMSGAPLPPDKWDAATLPVLVMDGGASPPWIRTAARELADVLPDAQHRTLEGQAHNVAPEVIAPELGRFFTGQ